MPPPPRPGCYWLRRIDKVDLDMRLYSSELLKWTVKEKFEAIYLTIREQEDSHGFIVRIDAGEHVASLFEFCNYNWSKGRGYRKMKKYDSGITNLRWDIWIDPSCDIWKMRLYHTGFRRITTHFKIWNWEPQ